VRISRVQRLAVLIGLGAFTPSARAQAPVPQTYSYIQDPAISIMGPSIIKVVRDGAKEVVDQILPIGPGRTKEFHNHILYDFQAHKIYTKLVSDPSVPCTVMSYTSPAVPEQFDVITGSAASRSMTDFLAHATVLREEIVNGVPARVMELTIAQMTETVWIADSGGFPVKVVIIPPGGVATTTLEVKQLSFAKPPASALIPPSDCNAIKGEAMATGVHAELAQDGPVSKPTTNVTSTASPPAKAPMPQAVPPARARAVAPRVTAVELSVTPAQYSGTCPVTVKLVGTLKADGPGSAYFQFQAGAVGANGEGAVQMGTDGTATVTSEGQVRRTPMVQHVRFLAGMEPRGHQENAKWTDALLDIHCTNTP
jgi:hypothetical protein